jgi:hypothetical protein
VKEKKAFEIIERAKEKAEEARAEAGSDDPAPAEKGNLGYLPFHPAAWTEICNELDEATKEEYLVLADQWNRGVVPRDVQQKCACLTAYSSDCSTIFQESKARASIQYQPIHPGHGRANGGKAVRTRRVSGCRRQSRQIQVSFLCPPKGLALMVQDSRMSSRDRDLGRPSSRKVTKFGRLGINSWPTR